MWIYKHPTVHLYRQLASFSVFCSFNGGLQRLAFFDLHRDTALQWSNVTSGWVALRLEKPCISKRWELKGLKGRGKRSEFYVFDMLLGNDLKERRQLPSPASSKINGYCVTHQEVAIGDSSEWLAMRWDMNAWQPMFSFRQVITFGH